MKIYDAFHIDWDTDDFTEEDAVAMGTDEPLQDLPSEVFSVELDDEEDPEEGIQARLEKWYGFCVKAFDFAEVDC